MSLRRYDPKLLDDITAVAGHLSGEVEFLRSVLCMVWRNAMDGRVSGRAVDKHFALKEIEGIVTEALARTNPSRQEGAR